MLWIFFFRNNNPRSDIRLRLKKSAEVIVPQIFFLREGLNVKSL